MRTSIDKITSLPKQLWADAFIEASKPGSEIINLGGLAYTILQRENKQTGFQSFDDFDENESNSLHEKIAAPDFSDIEISKISTLNDTDEKVLDLVNEGGAALGRFFGKTARTGQLILLNFIEKIWEERSFKEGGSGQGALFSIADDYCSNNKFTKDEPQYQYHFQKLAKENRAAQIIKGQCVKKANALERKAALKKLSGQLELFIDCAGSLQ